MASTYLTKTFASSGTSDKIATISLWCKRAVTGAENSIITAGASLRDLIRFETSGALRVRLSNGASDLTTNRLFRDVSAWYNLIIKFDTTQATASDRIKIYVNGVEETSFSTTTYPSQNQTLKLGTANPNHIGNDSEQTNPYFNGSMTHFHFIDGTAYDASTFGETDSTSGIWKPKASPTGITYGTNGFFLKMENSGAMGTDSSGNSNTFTVSGTLTQNVDTPSNVFATLNVLASTTSQNEFQYGNLEHYGTSNWTGAVTTLGASSGKYYAEVKVTDRDNFSVGIVTLSGTAINNINTNNNGKVGKYVDSWGIEGSGSNLYKGNNGSSSSYGSGFSNNDIAMIALDVGTGSNGAVYFGKNGTWFDSGNPATGSNPAFSSLSFSDAVGFMSGLETGRVQWNFGQGYFGTTQVASANADANGHGKMEYAVPTGYYTLNTKNLKEFG